MVNDEQETELVAVAGEKYKVEEGEALLCRSCDCFTKKSVSGIAAKIKIKFPSIKNLLVSIFTIQKIPVSWAFN
jgi:hypothetical protein